eukprot:TRINITY_DN2749_c0_g1_i2.p1 TRINITY_DN2749_c0_g1~~TRINITY_DN2749_c0_g1_i2.p1  ORF type:complete len:310 (+),score=54.41 TRINITY_DN2749_c0_g1_i2:129-932(+)
MPARRRFRLANAAQSPVQRIVGMLNRAVVDDAARTGGKVSRAVSELEHEQQLEAAAVVVRTCTLAKSDPPAKGVSAEICSTMLREVDYQRKLRLLLWVSRRRGDLISHDVLRYLGLWIPNFRSHFFSMMEGMFDRGTEEQSNRAASMLASLCESGQYPLPSLVHRLHDTMCGPEDPPMEHITRAACVLQTCGKFLHDACAAKADRHIAERWQTMQRRLGQLRICAPARSRREFMLTELQTMRDSGWRDPKTLIKLHARPCSRGQSRG